MDLVKAIIRNKPMILVLITLFYLIVCGIFKWHTHVSLDILWFIVGGVIGIYFLDGAEVFFHVTPSPFHTIVFTLLFCVLSFFVVTSSDSLFARTMVLSVYLQLVLRQIGERNVVGNLDSWYRAFAGGVDKSMQLWILFGVIALFFIETYIFII
jgi:hypothetical protein